MRLEAWVPGSPKTKGSMRVVNNRRGVLTESVAGSTRWRQLVAYSVAGEIRVARALRGDIPPTWPLTGPVFVELAFSVPAIPTAARAGDLDKLARNVLDALSACSRRCGSDCRNHAGLYLDDVQVVAMNLSKVGPVAAPGLRISAWELGSGGPR